MTKESEGKKQITAREAIQYWCSFGRWQPFWRDFLNVMTLHEAVVLSYLINTGDLEHNSERTKKGWFRCSTRKITDNLKLSKHHHETSLQKLKSRGYIKLRMIGNPAKRWIWIDFVLLQREVLESLDNDSSRQDGSQGS